MYRRPKFLEVLLEIRQEMAREADYDTDLFAEIVRTGGRPAPRAVHSLPADDAREPDARPARAPRRRTA